jgi:ketosteroid isomerase-like protein
MTVSKSDAQIQTDGQLGWVVGVEHAQLQLKSGGESVKFDAFSTHVLEKVDSRWLLVSHHAQVIPKESPFY